MNSEFVVIREEFDEELEAIKAIISAFADPKIGSPKTRVAAVNSATLLLAATFEEFVRKMARAYARSVVNGGFDLAVEYQNNEASMVSTKFGLSLEG